MSNENPIKDIDITKAVTILVYESARTQASLDIILGELAEMRARNNDLMGDGQKLSADEIYNKFTDEIARRTKEILQDNTN